MASLKGLPSAEEVKDLKRRLEIAEKTLIDQGKNIGLAHDKCAGFESQFVAVKEWEGLTTDRLEQIEKDIEELKARPIAVEAPKIEIPVPAPVKEFDLADLWKSDKWKDLLERI